VNTVFTLVSAALLTQINASPRDDKWPVIVANIAAALFLVALVLRGKKRLGR